MPLTLPEGEPAAGPWIAMTCAKFVGLLRSMAPGPASRPLIVAVDGRGAAGKSTLATRLCEQVTRSALVHTDDIAWNEPYFEWGHLLSDEVLRQRPWERAGLIVAGTPTIPLEGDQLAVAAGLVVPA